MSDSRFNARSKLSFITTTLMNDRSVPAPVASAPPT